jgi:hypothetical protein
MELAQSSAERTNSPSQAFALTALPAAMAANTLLKTVWNVPLDTSEPDPFARKAASVTNSSIMPNRDALPVVLDALLAQLSTTAPLAPTPSSLPEVESAPTVPILATLARPLELAQLASVASISSKEPAKLAALLVPSPSTELVNAHQESFPMANVSPAAVPASLPSKAPANPATPTALNAQEASTDVLPAFLASPLMPQPQDAFLEPNVPMAKISAMESV